MKKTFVVLLLVAVPAFATMSVKRSPEKPKTLNVEIVDEPLSAAVKAVSIYLPRRIQMLVSGDPVVNYSAREVAPEAALRGIAAAADATLDIKRDQYWIHNDHQPSVTLDVKDQDIRTILKSMQRQCGIKNLVIDPQVQGLGTFLFHDVPCRTAFDTVFRTMGLASVDYPNSVITVSTRH